MKINYKIKIIILHCFVITGISLLFIFTRYEVPKKTLQDIEFTLPFNLDDGIVVTSPFGERKNVFDINDYKTHKHKGTDLISVYKAEVLAIEDGIVTTHYVPPRKGSNWSGHPIYGGMIVIEHKNGYESLYAHLSSSYVREGQKVKKGDIIGRMGGTGKVKGEHLHLEIIKDNKNLNPLRCFNNIFVDENGNLYKKE